MAQKDIYKLVLIMMKSGLFDWTIMPFGMKNATNSFLKTMIEVFNVYLDKFLKVFVDDLNVHCLSWEEHLKHLHYVLLHLKEVNLKLNLGKCDFAKFSLSFLGYIVSRDGTQPSPRKIKTITNFPIPTIVINVRAFLGLTCHYKNYIKGYSHMAIPLFELTKKDVTFVWNPNYQSAFETLKDALVCAPIMVQLDFTQAFILDVNQSTHGRKE